MFRSTINTTLNGILDLFQLRTGGANPQVLASHVQPTMDFERWYLEPRAVILAATITSLLVDADDGPLTVTATQPFDALGSGGTVVVPQNETWVLLPGSNVRARITGDAGSSTRVNMRATIGGGVASGRISLPTTFEGFESGAAGKDRGQQAVLNQIFHLGPGARLEFWQNGSTVVAPFAIDFAATLKLIRLRV